MLAAATLFLLLRPAQAAEPVTIGVVASEAGAPVFLAQALGYFSGAGLEAKIVQFGAAGQVPTAAAAGDLDFGSTALTAPLCVFAHDGKLRIIGSGGAAHQGFRTTGFVASNAAYAAGLRGFGDLRGHSVATTQFGGVFQYDIALILKKYGVPESSVRTVALQSNGNIASAISGGQVDAAVLSTANIYAVVNPGKAKLLGWVDDELSAAQGGVTFATARMVAEHPDTVRRFLAAYRKGSATWDQAFLDATGRRADQPQSAKIIAIVAAALKQPPNVIGGGVGYFDPEARISLSDMQELLDWYYVQGMIKTHMDAAALVDKGVAVVE